MAQDRKARGSDGLLERPLTARSIVASLLLGMHPPRLSSARLVRWCALFGVAEGTARVALSRMVERGELRAEAGVYQLAGALERRQPAQDWVLAPAVADWSGDWSLAVVTAGPRPAGERGELRVAASRLRYGEVREGVWGRPANLPRESGAAADWAVLDGPCTWWVGRPDTGEDLADRLFRPATWASRAALLLERLRDTTSGLDGGAPALAPAFVAGAAALQHLRRDPLLPRALLPPAWPGDELRGAYRAYQQAFTPAVTAFFADG